MKRILSIVILTSFLLSTVGVIAGTYCCKKSMTAIEHKSCCKTTSKGCCEKEVKLLKVNDDYVSSAFHSIGKVFSHTLIGLTNNSVVSAPLESVMPFNGATDHAPPGRTDSILPFVQTFLI